MTTITPLDAFDHDLPSGWAITVLAESAAGWACQLSRDEHNLMCHGGSPHEAVDNAIRMTQGLS